MSLPANLVSLINNDEKTRATIEKLIKNGMLDLFHPKWDMLKSEYYDDTKGYFRCIFCPSNYRTSRARAFRVHVKSCHEAYKLKQPVAKPQKGVESEPSEPMNLSEELDVQMTEKSSFEVDPKLQMRPLVLLTRMKVVGGLDNNTLNATENDSECTQDDIADLTEDISDAKIVRKKKKSGITSDFDSDNEKLSSQSSTEENTVHRVVPKRKRKFIGSDSNKDGQQDSFFDATETSTASAISNNASVLKNSDTFNDSESTSELPATIPTGAVKCSRNVIKPIKKPLVTKFVQTSIDVSLKTYSQRVIALAKRKDVMESIKKILRSGVQIKVKQRQNMLSRLKSIEGEIQQEEKALKKVKQEDRVWTMLESNLSDIQPQTFGPKALSTFNHNKMEVLGRLRESHDALLARPAVSELSKSPRNMKSELKLYQRHGLAFMMWREKQNPKGGILADDMGLGKTLAVIALVLATKDENYSSLKKGSSDCKE